MKLMQDIWNRLNNWVTDATPHLVKALAILVIGWLVTRMLAGIVRRLLSRSRLGPTWTIYLGRLTFLVLMLIVLLAVFQELGVQLTSVIAILGAAGLAVALALQNSLSHLAAGLSILSLRLFRVGDTIEVLGVKGRVEDIQLFHTILNDPTTQTRLILPNGKVTDNVIRVHP